MIVIGGYFDFDSAADIAGIQAAAKKMVAATLKETGCIDYCFAADIAHTARIRVFEVWQDQDALGAHMASPHMAAFMTAMGGTKRTSASVSAYTATGVKKMI